MFDKLILTAVHIYILMPAKHLSGHMYKPIKCQKSLVPQGTFSTKQQQPQTKRTQKQCDPYTNQKKGKTGDPNTKQLSDE